MQPLGRESVNQFGTESQLSQIGLLVGEVVGESVGEVVGDVVGEAVSKIYENKS